MIFVSRVLRFGRSSISGVTYTPEELQKMIDKWKEKTTPSFGVLGQNILNDPLIVDLSTVVSEIVDMYLDDEGLVVHQNILKDTEAGSKLVSMLEIQEEFPDLLDGAITVSPNITGKLDNGYTATDLILISVRFDVRVK